MCLNLIKKIKKILFMNIDFLGGLSELIETHPFVFIFWKRRTGFCSIFIPIKSPSVSIIVTLSSHCELILSLFFFIKRAFLLVLQFCKLHIFPLLSAFQSERFAFVLLNFPSELCSIKLDLRLIIWLMQ